MTGLTFETHEETVYPEPPDDTPEETILEPLVSNGIPDGPLTVSLYNSHNETECESTTVHEFESGVGDTLLHIDNVEFSTITSAERIDSIAVGDGEERYFIVPLDQRYDLAWIDSMQVDDIIVET